MAAPGPDGGPRWERWLQSLVRPLRSEAAAFAFLLRVLVGAVVVVAVVLLVRAVF